MRLKALKFPFRRAPKDAPPTFFFHIPKCAGTSVWETLFHVYGARNVFIVNSARSRQVLAAMPPERCRSYGAVGGHWPLRNFRDLLGEMTAYYKIITLRDPIDRAISEYNYVRAQTSHPRNAMVSQQSLEMFAAETLAPDRQVKLLAGRGDDVEGAFDIVTRFFDDWSFSNGVDALIQRLYAVTGVEPCTSQHKNKGAPGLSRAALEPATLRLLEARNKYDLALIEALRSSRAQ